MPRTKDPRAVHTTKEWYPKQPALFMMNEVIDCPVPVFGRLPKRFLETVVQPALGVARADILHICSGSLREGRTVDIRPEVRPWLVADALNLPLADDSEEAVFLDPPYTPAWARQYGVKYPPTYPLLREALRVLKPGSRLALFHFLVPYTPKGARLVKVYGVTVGMGYQIRALSVFKKDAAP